jgi:hypothetical protein
MTSVIFKKSALISLLAHLAVFGIFGVSFGRRLPVVNYGKVIFQGCVLNNFDFGLPNIGASLGLASYGKSKLHSLENRHSIDSLRVQAKSEGLSGSMYLKPAVLVSAVPEKQVFIQKAQVPFKNKERTAVMFYPRLPPYFSLYFKDRQVVHMELMFQIGHGPQHSSISIKREISSGNLEADLLCMRYINHYLFVQQGMFTSSGWQSVKIELSPKNDR